MTDNQKSALDAMREALKPFADLAAFITEAQRDSRSIIFGMDNVVLQRLTVGHLRAAKAALSAPVPPEDIES